MRAPADGAQPQRPTLAIAISSSDSKVVRRRRGKVFFSHKLRKKIPVALVSLAAGGCDRAKVPHPLVGLGCVENAEF
jgi:hypothetical protein